MDMFSAIEYSMTKHNNSTLVISQGQVSFFICVLAVTVGILETVGTLGSLRACSLQLSRKYLSFTEI